VLTSGCISYLLLINQNNVECRLWKLFWGYWLLTDSAAEYWGYLVVSLQIWILGLLHCFMQPGCSFGNKGIVSSNRTSVKFGIVLQKFLGWFSAVLVLLNNDGACTDYY
jgi:hypothetical protein